MTQSRPVKSGVRLLCDAVRLMAIALVALLAGLPALMAADAVPGDPLTGDGTVTRSLVTYAELTSALSPSAPVDDAAFGVPSNAAPPLHQFEGTLDLVNEDTTGGFLTILSSITSVAAAQHLPEVSIEFVQNGSHLIPTNQLVRITGSTYWNLIVGPGRVWTETSDSGLTRASFPFALVQRNANCSHNGEMTFVFNDSTISNVRYQITQETCYLRKFNMWGQIGATYTPQVVAGALAIENAHAAEITNRMPTKPFSALATDYPGASMTTSGTTTLSAATIVGATNVKVASVTGLAVGQIITIDTGGTPEVRTIIGPVNAGTYAFNGTTGAGGTGVNVAPALTAAHASGATMARPVNFGAVAQTNLFGVVYGGVNYISECPTRYGFYPFCADFRLPSYSTAKTIMANTALMRLSQKYGDAVYNQKLRDHIPEMAADANWPAGTSATFNNAADMASGNWTSKGYEVDEGATNATTFLNNETYASKMTAALAYAHHAGQAGITWNYRTSDTFLLGAALNGYLTTQEGAGADVFNLLVDEVFVPLKLSAGARSTLRTDNAAALSGSPTAGMPWGGYGLFFNVDDVGKLSKMMNNDLGKINGVQVLSRKQLLSGLQRLQSDRGVPANSSLATTTDSIAGSYRYSNGFWAYPSTTLVSGCNLRLPFLSGYGGITIGMMPNGATYYYFSDNNSFVWASTATELNKISPMCATTTTTLVSDAPSQSVGDPVTFTATVASADRNWAPTGTVRFKNGAAFLSNQLQLDENGAVQYTTSALPTGTNSITAVYSQENTNSTTGYTSTSSTTTVSATNACNTTDNTVTLTVGSSTGFAVGDDVIMGTGSALTTNVDEIRITAIPSSTQIQYTGACTYFAHTQPFPVLLRKTAGGGFATSTSSTLSQEITLKADLSISKTDTPDPVIAGANLSYTIMVSNAGPSTASSVVVTDTLPAGVSLVSTSGCSQDPAGAPTCNLGSINSGGSAQYTVVVKVDPGLSAGSVLTNDASVASATGDPNTANNSVSQDTTVNRQSDLAITKSDDVDPVLAGNTLVYTVTVANNGPSDASNVQVSDTLPSGVSFVATDGCAGDPNGVPDCNLGTIAAGSNAAYTVTVAVDSSFAHGASVQNSASVSSDSSDVITANDTIAEDTAVERESDLAISLTDDVDPVVAGSELVYTVKVENLGPSDADAVVTDTLPAGVSYVSDTDSCSEDSPGVLTCSAGTVTAGGSSQFDITVQVDSADASVLTNNVSVALDSAGNADPNDANDMASVTTDVVEQADLSISKGDSPDPVFAGNQLTYTLTVTNNSQWPAADVVVTDTLPDGVTLVSTSGCAEDTTGVPTCSLGTIAAEDNAQYTVTVKVNSDVPHGTTLANSASVASSTTDPEEGNNTVSQGTEVQRSSDLSITKVDDADPVLAGNTLVYTVTVSNAGPSDAANVQVSDTLPADVTFVSTDGCAGDPGGVPNCNLGTIAAGDDAAFSVTVKVGSGVAHAATIQNSVTASSDSSDPDSANDSVVENTQVQRESDLAVSKTDSVDPVTAGTELSYTIKVENLGPSDADAVVTDTLPAGLSYVSDTAACSENLPGVLSCDAGTVAAGGSAEFDITVSVDSAESASVTNNVSVALDSAGNADPHTTNNSGSATTAIVEKADLSISKTDSADPVSAGAELTYTITVSNNSAWPASDVVVTDTLPDGVTLVSTSGCAEDATGVPTCSLGTIAGEDSAQYTIVVKVDPDVPHGSTLTNTAAVASSTTDPDGDNNTVYEDTLVNRSADLSVSKTDNLAGPVTAGSQMTYTVTVSNAGPSDASAVVVTDTLPAGVELVSTSGCTEDPNGAPNCALGTIAAGAEAGYDITVLVDSALASGATITNAASVAATEVDPEVDNNNVSIDTNITRKVDIQISKTESIETVVAGSGAMNLQYVVTVYNDGPSDVTGLVVAEVLTLPAGVVLDSVTPSDGSWLGDPDDEWMLDLEAKASTTLTINLTVGLSAAESSNSIADTASVADVGGGETLINTGDDSATESTGIRWPTATFQVVKDYADGGAGEVTMTLECGDTTGLLEYDPEQGTSPASLTVKRFDIDLLTTAGTACTITETMPEGYNEHSRTADCDVEPAADQGVYECAITNSAEIIFRNDFE